MQRCRDQFRNADWKTIGSNIRDYREYIEMNQESLAKKIGVSRQTISKIENNQLKCNFLRYSERLQEIATVLGCKLEDLLQSS